MKHYLPRGGARLLRDTDEAYKRFLRKLAYERTCLLRPQLGPLHNKTANTREVHFQVLFYVNLERNRERLSRLS